MTLITFECPERASFALQDLKLADALQAGSALNPSDEVPFTLLNLPSLHSYITALSMSGMHGLDPACERELC